MTSALFPQLLLSVFGIYINEFFLKIADLNGGYVLYVVLLL